MSQNISLALRERLIGLEEHLRNNIKGQDEIISPIVAALQEGELGLTDPSRPKARFLFLGPTGVGKTEIALNFTQYLKGENKLIRIDMSEFQLQESLAVLIGGKLGERGLLGQYFDQVQKDGTLLFDEIEKAHKRVLDLLLQILDAGRITLANGETLNLSNFYIVATSNIAAQAILSAKHSVRETIVRFVERQAQAQMRPEIYGRFKPVLVFNRLEYDTQLEIAKVMIDKEIKRFAELGYYLEAGPEIIKHVVEKGVHPRLGARPMRGAVEDAVRGALRKNLLSGGSGNGLLIVNEKLHQLELETGESNL